MAFDWISMHILLQAFCSHLTIPATYFCLFILYKKSSANSISFAVASSEKPWILPTAKISEDSKVLPPQTGNGIHF